MNIELNQSWSCPPAGPDIRVHAVTENQFGEPIVAYGHGAKDQAAHQKPLSVFQESLIRMNAKPVSEIID